MKYAVECFATKVGSAHMNNREFRRYIVEAETPEKARHAAIEAAYIEGGLEHINPRKVTLIGVAP